MVDLGCIWRFYIIMQLQPPKLDPSLLILPTAKCWGDDPKMEAKVLPRHIAGTMGLDPSPWSHHGSSLYSLNHAIFFKKPYSQKTEVSLPILDVWPCWILPCCSNAMGNRAHIPVMGLVSEFLPDVPVGPAVCVCHAWPFTSGTVTPNPQHLFRNSDRNSSRGPWLTKKFHIDYPIWPLRQPWRYRYLSHFLGKELEFWELQDHNEWQRWFFNTEVFCL